MKQRQAGRRGWHRARPASHRITLRAGLLALALGSLWPALLAHANLPMQLDLRLFRAAACHELQAEYRATLEVNRKALEEMRRSDRELAGNSAAGIASYTSLGFGTFSSGEHGESDSAIEELEAYQNAIIKVAAEKKCALPESGSGSARAAQ